MGTTADKLNRLLTTKNALKAALEAKGKDPSNVLNSYVQSIYELDNEDQVSYVLTNADGTQKAYAQLSNKTPITLTAQANDIRLNTSAITNEGYTEGTKEIPAYHSRTGAKIIQAGDAMTITLPRYDYSELQVVISNFNTDIYDSVEVTATTIDNSVYETKSTNKLADITLDADSKSILLNVTADVKSVLRYFTMKEEL